MTVLTGWVANETGYRFCMKGVKSSRHDPLRWWNIEGVPPISLLCPEKHEVKTLKDIIESGRATVNLDPQLTAIMKDISGKVGFLCLER